MGRKGLTGRISMPAGSSHAVCHYIFAWKQHEFRAGFETRNDMAAITVSTRASVSWSLARMDVIRRTDFVHPWYDCKRIEHSFPQCLYVWRSHYFDVMSWRMAHSSFRSIVLSQCSVTWCIHHDFVWWHPDAETVRHFVTVPWCTWKSWVSACGLDL